MGRDTEESQVAMSDANDVAKVPGNADDSARPAGDNGATAPDVSACAASEASEATCALTRETPEEALARARAFFAGDRFATVACGALVDEAAVGHGVCSMEITPEHRNAMGGVMGGAVFTLADFAGAVASNFDQPPTVTASSEIRFLAAAKGARLVATCDADRTGRRLCHYTCHVTDDLGTLVAIVTSTSMRA